MATVGTTSFTVVLPMPHRYLNPNAHISERYRQQLRRGHRDMATVDAKEELKRRGLDAQRPLFPSGTPLVVTATCTPYRGGRKWDDDNLRAALKGYLDGLQRAGVYADDKDVEIDRVFWKPPEGPGEVALEVRLDTRASAAAIEVAARDLIYGYRHAVEAGTMLRLFDALAAALGEGDDSWDD